MDTDVRSKRVRLTQEVTSGQSLPMSSGTGVSNISATEPSASSSSASTAPSSSSRTRARCYLCGSRGEKVQLCCFCGEILCPVCWTKFHSFRPLAKDLEEVNRESAYTTAGGVLFSVSLPAESFE